MPPTSAPFHPLRALAALVAAAAALHGVCAHAGVTDDDDDRDSPVQVRVVGRHLPLRTACPDVDQELPDELVQAWHDYGAPTTVPVEFKLRDGRVFDVQSATESPRLAHQLRRALQSLNCDGANDDETHTVDLVVRFVDPKTADPDTRVAIEVGGE
jgi:hypothetical protein